MIKDTFRAKIVAPEEVVPLINGNMKITATNSHCGLIEVYDINTNNKLWDLQVYKIKINPDLESDVQWVFITKLEMKGNKILVTNSKDQQYLVNIEQRKIENNTLRISDNLYIIIGGIIIAISVLLLI